MIKQKLMDKFGKEINHHSLVYNEEEKFRYFLDKIKPRNVIEIGTYQGVSSAILSEYAKKVFTIDVIFMPLRMKIHRHLKLDNVWCHIIKTDEQKKEYIEGLIEAEKIDFCFIDGGHNKGQPVMDFELCKKCDNILLHDYSPAFKEVYDLCNNVKGYKKEIKGTFCLLQKKKNILSDTEFFKKITETIPKKNSLPEIDINHVKETKEGIPKKKGRKKKW